MTPKEALIASLVAERFAVYFQPVTPARGWTSVEQATHREALRLALGEDDA